MVRRNLKENFDAIEEKSARCCTSIFHLFESTR